MKVAVIGCGYLGAVHAASMAELGHEVVGLEIDRDRVRSLQAGTPNFFEPGLEELLIKHLEKGSLKFTSDAAEMVDSDIYFIGVGTPLGDPETGAANLTYVFDAVRTIIRSIELSSPQSNPVIVGKSTVPVGTARELQQLLKQNCPEAELIWNPEFLREGYGILDTLHPDRVIYGLDSSSDLASHASQQLDRCYAGVLSHGMPKLEMSYESAELVKVAANSFLATKVSFINSIAQICDKSGGDVTLVAKAIGLDERIGPRFLNAGIGYGGGCLPKDVAALIARANELGANSLAHLLNSVQTVNESQIDSAVEVIMSSLSSIEDPVVAVLGASFKPKSDDLRESRSIEICKRLLASGVKIRVTDPMATEHVATQHPEFDIFDSVEGTVSGSDAVLILTEWSEYVNLDASDLIEQVRHPIVFDGRNSLKQDDWTQAGWEYLSLGRNSIRIPTA